MKVRAFLAVLAAGVWLGCASASSDVSDPSDLTVWPNRVSRANSDRWLVEHHDQLQRMNPRVLVLNFSCFLESLSHAIEGTAHSGAIPYFTRYFHEFAGFALDKRHGLPWDSFYPLWGEGKGIEYPDPTTAVVRDGSRTWRLTNYVAAGGNVHFSPNGRSHYDLGNTNPVMSTIEDWRIGSGPGGVDLGRPWTITAYARYLGLAPDCMGPWLIYWRQNFPGLNNRQRDEDGRPMKNWWPFLFY